MSGSLAQLMPNGSTRPKGRSRHPVAVDYGDSVNFTFQVDLCHEELVPRLKGLAREIDARALIFSLMCHLGWGLQAAQLLGCCTPKQSIRLLERSCRKGTCRQAGRASPLEVRVDLTQLDDLQERISAEELPFDVDAAEAFAKIARWLGPMSKATSDLVVYTCVADILSQILDGQDARVIESVWEWVRELVLSSPLID